MDLLVRLISLLTWNISLNATSNCSPPDWDRNQNSLEILRIIEDKNPDILTLQELPDEKFGLRFTNYNQLPLAMSHSGLTGLLIKKGIKILSYTVLESCVVAKIQHLDKLYFIASCHLIPEKQNATYRLFQLAAIKLQITDKEPLVPVIVAGDLNMRENETKYVLDDLSWDDAFIRIGSPKTKKFTWDSKINHYHKESYPFIARFDRIFLYLMEVTHFELIGNEPVTENPNHFISDHFGIYVQLLPS